MAQEIQEDFQLNEIDDALDGCVESRLSMFSKEYNLRRNKWGSVSNGCHVIDPNERFYRCWVKIIVFWSTYSSFFTPLEFGFYRGLPEHLQTLDMSVQIVFLADVILQFFVAYKDPHTYNMVSSRKSIALRYTKTSFALDLLGCFPWDTIYKVTRRSEIVRGLIWIRLYRTRKIIEFFQNMEKDIRINYLFTRIVKLITVELYCTHTAACIFYYLATTLPPAREGYTWIGSLQLGDYKYINFREIDLWTRYITSLYFAIVTMATVGYGEIHAVNTREMIFIMIYVSFDMILGAYLIGNMTALIVKGSNTERFRDKMTDVIKYMNRNKLGKDLRSQIKNHLQLKYENSFSKDTVLEDIPIAIRAKISQDLYSETVKHVPLFKGCTDEFVNQIVTKLHEELILPGEVVLEQGNAVDQIYIVSYGSLEEVVTGEDRSEKVIARLGPNSIFGEVAVLCNIPQPYTVRVCELCRLLRMEKQSLTSILQLYFKDNSQILNNLLKGKDTELRIKQLELDITYLIAKQDAELALRVNSAAYHGDLYQLKGLINAGADPLKTDYDGRTPLHLAASRGYEDIVMFLIRQRASVNCTDKFGNSPLLEAVKAGNVRVSKILVEHGASINIEDAGSYLCKVVTDGNVDLLKRLLENGIDPNSNNYDQRTPLHIAAAEGLHLVADILIKTGANVLSKDRWGNTPLDEGRKCGSKPLVMILEKAKADCKCDDTFLSNNC
ncbi:hypothetical protein AMTRI_Chr11g102180 [Amborella trichopoda]|uniref:Potassium channel n=1 Tax=Amborella trichopoda TaxID=13333 RepID=W1NWX5_AMBTC|nr:potassium channel KOR2 [Amborella trichopoda]ERM99785.1 hypothetical protein AMTR_s00099p00151170 [Amborella trichopoda]|eukprot:XP_006836932.1 potassium channel KOR2 [Amborella trichopoda]